MTAVAIPQHSSLTPEHYTPLDILDAARRTMGGFDLDPATTATVNAHRVQAETFFTKEDDGLARPWHGRVWLNPPGGKAPGNRSKAAVWWAKLAEEYAAGRVVEAVFLGFTLEILATSQDAVRWLGDFPVCVPRNRIDFYKEEGPGLYVKGGSPAHANVIAYLPRANEVGGTLRFEREFSHFGKVSTPNGGAAKP